MEDQAAVEREKLADRLDQVLLFLVVKKKIVRVFLAPGRPCRWLTVQPAMSHLMPVLR